MNLELLKKIDKYYGKWENVLVVFGCLCTFVCVILITADVLMRNIARVSIQGTSEMVQMMVLPIFLCALPYVQRKGANITMKFAEDKMSDLTKLILDLMGIAIGIFFFAIISKRAFTFAIEAFVKGDTTSGSVPIPIWPAKMLMAIIVATLIIRLIIDFFLMLVSYIQEHKNLGQKSDG